MQRLVLSILLVVSMMPRLAEAQDADISSITLERSGCMGTCPVYSVTLRSDGSARYVGRLYTPRFGTYVGTVNFAAFLSAVAEDDPWSLTDVDERVTDSPSLTLIMVRGGQTKTVHVRNYFGPSGLPDRFNGVAAAIDHIATNTRWTPQSVATKFAGEYLNIDDPSVLDELFIDADLGDGSIRALRERATNASCNSLYLPDGVSLGLLTPVRGRSDMVRLADGSSLRYVGGDVERQDRGTSIRYRAVDSAQEFTIRGEQEQRAQNLAHLVCP